MCNPKTATNEYNTQLAFPIEVEKTSTERTKRKLAPTFRKYENRQSFAILDVESMIPEHHVARVIDSMIEAIPDEQLFSQYPGGGRSSFHPKMMLKIILYSYSQKQYSCRLIEKMIRENLPAIWLAGMEQPDFRTINDFRGNRMQGMIDGLFESMVMELHRQGFVEYENYFLEGTKIEASANKYTFVFKKAVTGHNEKLKAKIRATLEEIHEVAEAEGIELGALSEGDAFTCPNGQRVPFRKYMKRKNPSGFVQDFKTYECEDCSGCPLKDACTKAKGNRQVHWNPVYKEVKEKARKALLRMRP